MRPGLLVWSGGKVDIAIQADAYVDATVIAEALNRVARPRIDGRQIPRVQVEQTVIGAVFALPIIDASLRHCARVRMNPPFFPVTASSTTMELFLASTYMVPSTMSGLNR